MAKRGLRVTTLPGSAAFLHRQQACEEDAGYFGHHSLSSYGRKTQRQTRITSLLHLSRATAYVNSDLNLFQSQRHRLFLIRSWVDQPHVWDFSSCLAFRFQGYRNYSCLPLTSSLFTFGVFPVPDTFHPSDGHCTFCVDNAQRISASIPIASILP